MKPDGGGGKIAPKGGHTPRSDPRTHLRLQRLQLLIAAPANSPQQRLQLQQRLQN